ncbi:hypothetical protein [Streptomyces sp. NPDC059575]|uniref:hypothetical protein n=1 Tax=Streptomyces sp. NPDC059575 TaxID=3346872 RepID=UPI0036A200A9
MRASQTMKSHASLDRGNAPTFNADTGEVRVPLSLYRLDEHDGDVPLVLSRAEAVRLRDALADLLRDRQAAARDAS